MSISREILSSCSIISAVGSSCSTIGLFSFSVLHAPKAYAGRDGFFHSKAYFFGVHSSNTEATRLLIARRSPGALGLIHHKEHKGGFADKRSRLLWRLHHQRAGALAKMETLRARVDSPWLLPWSRIAPPSGEVGLGNLAARPVLPWRSSGPIPHATLDTDANTA